MVSIMFLCCSSSISQAIFHSTLINFNLFADVPKLPYYQSDSEYDEMKEREEDIKMKSRKPSGPRTPDPYSVDDTAIMLPLFVAIGAFIPLLFCLCKL